MGKKKAFPAEFVVKDMAEAERSVAAIGVCQRSLAETEVAMNSAIAEVKGAYAETIAELTRATEGLALALRDWAVANRAELTDAGKTKTVKLLVGTLAWRNRPPSVAIRGVAKVLAYLRARRLSHFVRTKFEIDKEALLAEPMRAAKVPGVKIVSDIEDFVITPDATSLEEIVK